MQQPTESNRLIPAAERGWVADSLRHLAIRNLIRVRLRDIAAAKRRGAASPALFQTGDRFDQVVSVDMFEQVRNHGPLMARIETQWWVSHYRFAKRSQSTADPIP